MISILLCAGFVRLAEGKYDPRRGVFITNTAKSSLPDGMVGDGLSFEPEALAKFLTGLMRKHRFSERSCCLELDGCLVPIKVMTAPAVPTGKLKKIVASDMVQLIGSPSNYIIDYSVEDTVKGPEGDSHVLLVTALQRAKVAACYSAVRKAGLSAAMMTVSNSALSAFAGYYIGRDSTYIVADRTRGSLTLAAMSMGKCLLTRSVSLNLSLVNIFNSSDGLLNEVSSELSRTINFYGASQHGKRPPIERIYLTGDFASEPEIVAGIGAQLSVPVAVPVIKQKMNPERAAALIDFAGTVGGLML